MRRRFGQALRIGVAPSGMALVKTSRWQGEAVQVLAEQHGDGGGAPEALAGSLRQLLTNAGYARWPATIVLADELVRLWQVTPPALSARLADLEAAAALRFQMLYGESPAGWTISAGWDAAAPFLAAAVPRQLPDLLHLACAGQQLNVVEIVPQFIAGWNQWRAALKPDAWYGLLHEGVLTLGALERGAIVAVRAAALPDGADLDWLAAHVAREALRLNLAPPARLQVAGHLPAAWRKGQAGAGTGLACQALSPQANPDWSALVRLAVTGGRA